ncbi:cache domain-containing protein [Massilia sp. B-10]|nr:cache domain-containing protein [Massilia sp. B-10]
MGRFIGATGVEIRLDTLNQVLARYQKRYGRTIYFVSGDGKVVLSGATKGGAETLAQRSGMRDIAPSHPQPQHRTDQPGLPQRQVGRAGQFALCAGSELVPGGQNRTRAAPSARSRASSRSISASASASRCWC